MKLINKFTKAPNIWTLTKFYNPVTGTWTSATSIPSESSTTDDASTDVDEANIVWEAVDGTADTSLSAVDDINQTATTTTTTTTDTNTTI